MLRFALAQIAPRLARLQENLALHVELVQQAFAAGAEVVVFPELSLTGYFLRDLVPEVALRRDAAQLAKLASLTREKGMLAFGFVEETPDYRYFNAVAVCWQGCLQGVHRKIYLPTYGMFDEQRYWAAGRCLRTFDSPYGKIGVLICEDVWHLSLVVLLAAHEVDYAFFVANSPFRGPSSPEPDPQRTWHVLNACAAMHLAAPVAFVNRAGCEEGVIFWGGSEFLNPDGTLRARADLIDEQLLIVEYDPRQTRQYRISTPLRRDENLLLTYHELQNLLERRHSGIR